MTARLTSVIDLKINHYTRAFEITQLTYDSLIEILSHLTAIPNIYTGLPIMKWVQKAKESTYTICIIKQFLIYPARGKTRPFVLKFI
jgi:hypothetical protein